VQFGTKSVKTRHSVQHCCLSVHNVTLMLGSCNKICGHLDFVQFRVLLFNLWSVGILWCAVADFCNVSVRVCFSETSEHSSTAQRRNTLKRIAFIFCQNSAKNSESTDKSTCTVIQCCLYECVSEWQGFRAECIKWETRYFLHFTSIFIIIIFLWCTSPTEA
jgi:hypothetical protein